MHLYTHFYSYLYALLFIFICTSIHIYMHFYSYLYALKYFEKYQINNNRHKTIIHRQTFKCTNVLMKLLFWQAFSVVPSNRGRNVTLLSAISTNGMVDYEIFLVSLTSCKLNEFLELKIIPKLSEGQTHIILDNCRAHKPLWLKYYVLKRKKSWNFCRLILPN